MNLKIHGDAVLHLTLEDVGKIRIMAADEKGNLFSITLDKLCEILEKLKEAAP